VQLNWTIVVIRIPHCPLAGIDANMLIVGQGVAAEEHEVTGLEIGLPDYLGTSAGLNSATMWKNDSGGLEDRVQGQSATVEPDDSWILASIAPKAVSGAMNVPADAAIRPICL
jgi:hypothetical protein